MPSSLLVSTVATSRARVLVPALLGLLVLQLGLLWRSLDHTVTTLPRGVWIGAQLLALAAAAILLWRVVLVARHRSIPSVQDDELPAITVIVPAYNEGGQVYRTIQSLVASDYPRTHLKIVAVDDGSVDSTWAWMRRAAADFYEQVTAIHCPINRGKRHALYEGFEHAVGSVVVTVDSDSEVLPDTLRNLVSPFVVDPRVGAVAGNVRVLNREAGILPRMLDVAFTYAFEFMRASESEVGAVQCCPGAISAYRLRFVKCIADRWLAQTFFGRPANIGEDRAMTNLALAAGYHVKLQANAIVLTEVPVGLRQLSKMFLRWARSNVRETWVLAQFVFSDFRLGGKTGARVNFIWSVVTIAMGVVGFGLTVAALLASPTLLAWIAVAALASALWPATIFAASRGLRGALWAFPYAVLSATALAWIGPYGLVTAHRSGWLTRQAPALPPGRVPAGPSGPVPIVAAP